jgi:cation:H+ antiporter
MVLTSTLLSQFAVGAVALYTLITAAERAIDAFLSLARYYGVPDVLIGMTVIAIGTSLPEITAHLIASIGILSGALDYQVTSAVVLGGNMGSSTLQQTLLFGLFIIGFGQLQLSQSIIRDSYLPMLLAFALTLVVAIDGTVSRLDGVVLLVGYATYTYYHYRNRRRDYAVPETASVNVRRDALIGGVALLLVVLAATLLLAVAEVVVDSLALGGSIVGVITLGVAAALPELSTVMDAIRRRAPDIALGTLIGSNIVNPLVGIGLGGAISTYYVPYPVIVWDLPFKLVVGLGLYGYIRYGSNRTLSRREGGYLMILYFVFVVTRLLLFPAQ